MLITLQSTSDNDANDFSNYFRETVDILPKSEVALVSMSYNFENSITIDATNQTFQLRVGTDTLTTVTIPIGSYSPGEFETAIQNSLDNYTSNLPYQYSVSFSDITIGNDGVSEKLVLTIRYDPSDWDSLLVDKGATADRAKIQLDDPDMMSASGLGDGIITQNNTIAGLNLRSWHAGDENNTFPLWGHADDTDAARPNGYYRWTQQQNNETMYIALGDNEAPADIADAPIQWRYFANGTFNIYEINSLGTPQSILAAPVAYNAFDTFEIKIDAEPTGPGESALARYFRNGAEVAINATATRWEYRENSKLIPLGSFNSAYIPAQIAAPIGDYAFTDALTNLNITNPGSGYLAGEVIEITGAAGTAFGRVNFVGAGGSITTFVITSHGSGFVTSEPITITGKISGANNFEGTASLVQDTVDIATPGSGYSTTAADIILNDGVTTITSAVNILTVDGSGGVDTFDWSVLLPNQVATGHTLTIKQGANTTATITINGIDRNIPSVANVEYSTVARGPDEPLMPQKTATFSPSAGFLALTDLPAVSGDASGVPGLQSIASKAPSDSREAEQMLVNIDQFQIKSICKTGGVQKAVAAVPFGERENPTGSDPQSGYFFYEAYNLLYHDLSNSHTENHNQLRVRLTDAVGNQLVTLKHPTTITLDLRPRAR